MYSVFQLKHLVFT